MNKLIVVTIAILLTGCYAYVPEERVEQAIKVCETNGGLKYIGTKMDYHAFCNNGASFNLESLKSQ